MTDIVVVQNDECIEVSDAAGQTDPLAATDSYRGGALLASQNPPTVSATAKTQRIGSVPPYNPPGSWGGSVGCGLSLSEPKTCRKRPGGLVPGPLLQEWTPNRPLTGQRCLTDWMAAELSLLGILLINTIVQRCPVAVPRTIRSTSVNRPTRMSCGQLDVQCLEMCPAKVQRLCRLAALWEHKARVQERGANSWQRPGRAPQLH
jgi:hypothetical protein